MTNPWAGGMNYPQFSDVDIDYDGDEDLFIFDRSSNQILIFIQEDDGQGPYYRFLYNARSLFPSEIRYRATMVDYDQDGNDDLFTYSPGGLAVYRNSGNSGSGIQWELREDLIESEYHNGVTNLYVSASDIPAIVDVDGDGDMDILTFHIGGLHMEYHQNQSMDIYGIPDSLVFLQKNQCWGKFREDQNTNSILLNDPDPPCQGGDISNPAKFLKHAGSSVLALDIDNSGVLDLVLGDVAYPNLNLLINGGTTVNSDSPMISVDNGFPSNTTPASVQLFPAPFWVDVDFDGVKDLIVSPNAKNISENEHSARFYRNNGSNNLPNFLYVEDDFLQNQMIDHGTGSIPTFADINEDGLLDLFVASFFQYKDVLDKKSAISYYLNTGTATAPEFTLIDNDFLNLSQQGYGLRIVPAFGDIDDDGDSDLLLGREDGSIVFYENYSTGSGAVFTTGTMNYPDNLGNPISATSYCSPQVFDLDKDGLLDLILGKKSGEIVFYKNIGDAQNPSFELTNPQLGGIDVQSFVPDGFATPHFFRIQNTTYLFVGDIDGELNFYQNIDGNLATGNTFELSSATHYGIDVGGYSSFYVGDLNNNGRLEMYVGQDLGGIHRFEHDPNSQSSLEEEFKDNLKIVPNPAKDEISIFLPGHTVHQLRILDTSGQLLIVQDQMNGSSTVDVGALASGLYLVQVELENGISVVERLVIR